MILAECVSHAIEELKAAGVDTPQLDARLLICHALGIGRAQLLSQAQLVLSDPHQQMIKMMLARRVRHESVARIIGKREFWGLDFELNEATLEPRPDSETLVAAVLAFNQEKPHILDLGTGSGCLLLALLHERPYATGIGIDISARAIEQASHNAHLLGLTARAAFRIGNWLHDIQESFDVILSNPPYIPTADISGLMADVRNYDPFVALDGGVDGFTPYRLLIPQLMSFLKPQGIIAFETGQGQAPHVVKLMNDYAFQNVLSHRDLAGIERCVTARKQAE